MSQKQITYRLSFGNRGVERGTCSGPGNDLQPPQKTCVREGSILEKDIYPKASYTHLHTPIRIVACPQLKEGEICGRDESRKNCIEPYVISSPQKLAALPNETTVTFKEE